MKRLLIIISITILLLSSCRNIHRIPTQTYSDMFGNKISFNGDTIAYAGEELCIIKYDKCNQNISFRYNRYVSTTELIFSVDNKDAHYISVSYNAHEPTMYRVDGDELIKVEKE